ncbi:RlpA-like double-psi beta-barrel-protein domain-containing protein-containing protein [Halteromyces radiatus]|uniref:RlpA-like double-psi beta-barrel-protein domain-containing protein-containing protein n=1 Tax=Halteromyces radiatus TaxID=101107 RepID=UPI00222056EC|nr:RlpA-like double-psi beta-barrel-protein domain-containing protein-containing protein [Halteromyces radiatus]KAI8099093.1 RlpA-like double-psi beta-barrel-protein domain-containing protein-containing protein [Halteromyces radiatus]
MAAEDHGITYTQNGGIDWNSPVLKGSIYVDRGYDDASFDVSQNLKMQSVVDPGENWHTGKGTYYDVETRKSSCGIKATNKDMVAALNTKQFGDKSKDNKNCGKQVEITGPNGTSVKVKLIDGCDTCAEGDIDLSPAAFEKIASFSHGSISIKWTES